MFGQFRDFIFNSLHLKDQAYCRMDAQLAGICPKCKSQCHTKK